MKDDAAVSSWGLSAVPIDAIALSEQWPAQIGVFHGWPFVPVRSPGNAVRRAASCGRGRGASIRGRSTGAASGPVRPPERASLRTGEPDREQVRQTAANEPVGPSTSRRSAPGREQARRGAKLLRSRARGRQASRDLTPEHAQARTDAKAVRRSPTRARCTAFARGSTPPGRAGPRTGARSEGPGRGERRHGPPGPSPQRQHMPGREWARTAANRWTSRLSTGRERRFCRGGTRRATHRRAQTAHGPCWGAVDPVGHPAGSRARAK